MQLSAFVDGELPENEAELLLRRLSQDAELRQQVSEYLAIGRVMRGEPQVAGLEGLRDTVRRALDDDAEIAADVEVHKQPDRMLRPLAGFAIAATVALVGIFGLRQLSDGIEPGVAPGETVVDTGTAITEPDADSALEEYRRVHELVASPEQVQTRFTSLTGIEDVGQDAEILPETDAAADDPDDEDTGASDPVEDITAE